MLWITGLVGGRIWVASSRSGRRRRILAAGTGQGPQLPGALLRNGSIPAGGPQHCRLVETQHLVRERPAEAIANLVRIDGRRAGQDED